MAKIRWQTVSVSRLTGPLVPVVVMTAREAIKTLGYRGGGDLMSERKAGVLLAEMRGLCPWREDVELVKDAESNLVRVCVRRETSPRRMLPG